MAVGGGAIPVATSCTVGAKNTPCTALVHRTSDGELIVEFERVSELPDVSIDLERFVPEIVAAASLQSLCDEAARIFRELTGYDRVMIYRFDDEGHGEVFAETRKPDLEAFLGNRYPASDIPQIARRLYERNRVRLLADVNYKPVPLVPALVADHRQRSRHVSVLPAQRLADPYSISPEHGRGGDFGRLIDGQREAVGTDLLSSLFSALPELRIAIGVRASGRSARDPGRGAREFHKRSGRTRRSASRTADEGVDRTRRRLARRAVRPQPPLAASSWGGGRGAPVRGRGPDDRRRALDRGHSRDRALAQPDAQARCFRDREPRRSGAGVQPARRDRERRLGGHDLEPERRNADLVSKRTRAHGDVGRRSVQGVLGLRRSVRAFAAPVIRAVASDRQGHLGSLDGQRRQGGATDPDKHQRRRRSVSRGANPDRTGSIGSGVASGSRFGTAGPRRRRPWPSDTEQRRLCANGSASSRRP